MEYLRKRNDGYQLTSKVSKQLAEFETMVLELKAKQEEIKEAILKEMEKKNVVKIETDELVISYIAPTTRESFDSKKLKADNPSLYDEYVKISNVKSQVRLRVK